MIIVDLFLMNQYLLAKTIHIIAVISWMAGIFYLPRLFVYHCQVEFKSEEDKRFQIMEKRLLRVIMNPAMIITWLSGAWLVIANWSMFGTAGWLHIKLLFVASITIFHMACAKWRKNFLTGSNKRSEKFFRIVNEIPTLSMIIIVVLVVFKPFH